MLAELLIIIYSNAGGHGWNNGFKDRWMQLEVMKSGSGDIWLYVKHTADLFGQYSSSV